MDDAASTYEQATTGGVTVPLQDRGLLCLTGPQRVWFLQNTVTNDVEGLDDGRWVESFFLTPKGKVVSHFRVGALGEELWLDVDPPATVLADWFMRYRFRTKVEIEDRSGPCVAVTGRAARELAGPGEVRRHGEALAFGDALGEVPVAIVHGPLEDPAVPVAAEMLYELLRLEGGVPAFGVDYTTDNLPQEAGLTRIVSVEKGCYVGQETVARIHFRGHVNKVVRPLALEDADVVGRDLLNDGERVGVVTSAIRSPRLGAVGLGMIRVETPDQARLEVAGDGTAVVGPVPEGTKVRRTS